MTRRLLGALSLFVFVAAGASCSSGGSAGTVRPFSEVQADEFVFDADPADTRRGIFRVTTTVPMICAIAWGETEALGRFNNSLAMNGTGLTDHDVYLPGALPGRTYFFRVQGSTADGTLYQSEISTFTVPGGRPTVPTTAGERRTNLALDATVAQVSSEFSTGFAADGAIDDSGTTEWASAGDGDDAFIVVDLGRSSDISAVEFLTRTMLDGTAITETYTVTIDDSAPLGPFPAGTPVDPQTAALEASGRLVRFDVESSTGGNVGAVEVRVLAP